MTGTKPHAPAPDRFGPLHLGHLLLLVGGLALLAGSVWIDSRVESLPDFEREGPAEARKQAFFDYLAPRVRQANDEIRAERRRLLALQRRIETGQAPGWWERRWLNALARSYELDPDPQRSLAETVDALTLRVDTVPPALALVQAAVESGWGRSRFARQANNLFGHWCYEPGCGLVPARRDAGARHEVAAFESPRQSVERYLHNLNTHPPYAPFRQRRAALRAQERPLRAGELVEGLLQYSERRDAYVEEIETVLRVNRPLLEAALASSGPAAERP
ncbi:Bax protein [Wenzhouxiangella sp. XN79A]|uniref:glucosaminidase domain-containing protein n=1 Tax=Wenzhouxiangella sp. XN79A TaxID=2724193 RepID=UPI00144AF825|nr:glucosaminidase domain-containing protein [Wenzhouxiangella sp. XN79A]NKI34791.1 Bax protein [Wenzhouxiangella sp. XN79A]